MFVHLSALDSGWKSLDPLSVQCSLAVLGTMYGTLGGASQLSLTTLTSRLYTPSTLKKLTPSQGALDMCSSMGDQLLSVHSDEV